jgi:5-methylcytosine-specific restriction protein A
MMQDQPLCKMCDAKGFVTLGVAMDHIEPLFKGGSNDDENLQMLCVECHRKKTATDLGIRYKPTIGVDGWPVTPKKFEGDGGGEKSRGSKA